MIIITLECVVNKLTMRVSVLWMRVDCSQDHIIDEILLGQA